MRQSISPPVSHPSFANAFGAKRRSTASGPASGSVLPAKELPRGGKARRLSGPFRPAAAGNIYPAESTVLLAGRKEIIEISV
jgi:hypothetical protein